MDGGEPAHVQGRYKSNQIARLRLDHHSHVAISYIGVNPTAERYVPRNGMELGTVSGRSATVRFLSAMGHGAGRSPRAVDLSRRN